MKFKGVLIVGLMCSILGSASTYWIERHGFTATAAKTKRDMSHVQSYFSPHGGCTQACVEQINSAQKEILVQAYSFTSQPIGEALIAAHKRNVNVRVILDKSQLAEHGSELDAFYAAGIEVWIDGRHPIAHAKLMIIDGLTIIGGSFNYTKQAESNSENLLVIPAGEGLGESYVANWNAHLAHSIRFEGRPK